MNLRRSLYLLLTVGVLLSIGREPARAQHGAGGHGGGAGHPVAGFHDGFHGGFHGDFHGGWHGAYPYGYRGWGYWGYPGWWGPGIGIGIGAGYWGYPYYGYPYPYPYPYPVYVNSSYDPTTPAGAPPAGTAPPTGPPPPGANPPGPNAPVRLTDSDVLINVRVPADATVWMNGAPTNQTGGRREFISSGLQPGRTYTFSIRAQWTGPDGKVIAQERQVSVQGGERRNVDFFAPAP
jgi:uncharacterized protein (TIGR03000 family)